MNNLDVIEAIIKNVVDGKNTIIDIGDLPSSPLCFPYDAHAEKTGNDIVTVYGCPLLGTDTGYIVFARCEYCGASDGKLDGRNNCGHCGAEVR